ncbi:MAG: choice-of-anchor J domain-containing protein, partial [Candidatus Marinimicrobia bacterium]|nr:choice-of-anchor J domain-containing protein [Candidatus Neomarinimicrobiota bacterium]
FELVADSVASTWGYNYDNFGAPATNGNTIVFTYTDATTGATDLKVYSLGEDGLFGTADDISASIRQDGYYGSRSINGRYIVWREGNTDKNIMGYDLGEDMLYGTADDSSIFTICDDANMQENPLVQNGIVVWEDWRNAPSTNVSAPKDIYGYDLSNDTEFRSTPSIDSIMIRDFKDGRVVMNQHDWDTPSSDADILISHINGRIQSDYYQIDIKNSGEPVAQSYLTGETAVSPYYFNAVLAAAKGPLSALFVIDLINGEYRILAYSAVTGDWTLEPIPYSSHFTLFIEKENGMVLGRAINAGNVTYNAWTFNGQTGAFSARQSVAKPTGFAVGKNISLIWGDEVRFGWIWTYDADRDNWYYRSGNNNDPWHVIATHFSDSLAVLIHGQGDTVCTSNMLEVYDLQTHQWVLIPTSQSRLYSINRQTYENTIHIKVNSHFAAVALDRDAAYSDYVHTFGTGDDAWKIHTMPYAPVLEEPLLGENFILQQAISNYDDTWYGHIYNDCNGAWLPEFIESRQGIDDLVIYDDLMMAWYKSTPQWAKVWAYSTNADGIQELYLQYPGDYFTIKTGSKAGFVFEAQSGRYESLVHVFNGIKGEWVQSLEVPLSNNFVMDATGHTGIFLQKDGYINGFDKFTAYGYSALRDVWDEVKFTSNNVDGIFTSDFCGMLAYDHYYNQTNKMIHAFNGVEGAWSEDVLSIYNNLISGVRLDDRIMMLIEDGTNLDHYAKVHMYSPLLNMWNTTSFDGAYFLEGYFSTPTSVFAWDNNEFKIIFSTQTAWDRKVGTLTEIHVTDYAIAATLDHSSTITTYYFYPPVTEIIDEFEFTEGPVINVLSSWEVEVEWKTNKYSDTRLVWGSGGYYELIKKDTLEPTKDHRVRIDGMEAQSTYYYAVASIIPGVDTVKTDTLSFSTGADNTAPALVGFPQAYRIHDHEASVWWETNEPSSAILQWGLTTAYTDTSSYPETNITNAIRMYDLEKDTNYHYRIGGFDRYGNGPFYSGDYTFRTENDLKAPQNLATLDSTIWGCSYMNWDPPQVDSIFTRESFNSGIPVDWKIYNRGDDPKGNSWQSGYIGNNPVAYCSYGKTGEYQEEWLITNPVKMTTYSGGVLNFWHYGLYNDYDNAPNRVMMSMTGTNPEDFTTIWSSSDLPDDWELAQIDIDWYNNYGETVYFAFVYSSTFGEIWTIDNVYMDFDIDGYYENFDDLGGWTNSGGHWGLHSVDGNYAMGVDGVKESAYLPDPIETWDAWEISPFIRITESHHILGFWQMGWAGEYDTKPNEIRVVYSTYSIEASSEIVRTVYPVPNGWMWTTVDLSAYIDQTVMIGFRYNSNVGWWWNGIKYLAFWGEDWYIDDLYLFENAPAMVADPNAKPNEKPLKFASSPNGKPIDLGQFKTINQVQRDSENLTSEAPEGSIDIPKEKPLVAISLPEIQSDPAPSVLAEPKPELYGYEVYDRFEGETYYDYLGYVTSPSFVDWDTYLGYEREYYVEAVYDQGNSQPSGKALIKGGTSLLSNEYAYDTGVLYYSYWWYPGTAMANQFYFGVDSVLNIEQIKVHVAQPGSFKVSLDVFDYDAYYTDEFVSDVINVTEEGWYTIDVPTSIINESNEITVKFLPQDTLVQLSYEPVDGEVSWSYYGSSWASTSDIYYIRLIGEKKESPYI